MLSIDFEIISV